MAIAFYASRTEQLVAYDPRDFEYVPWSNQYRHVRQGFCICEGEYEYLRRNRNYHQGNFSSRDLQIMIQGAPPPIATVTKITEKPNKLLLIANRKRRI